MNHFKRAWLSVVRRKGKSLILLVLVFVLGNVIAGAFSIQQASKNVEKTIKYQLGSIATISIDNDAIMKEIEENPDFDFSIKGLSVKEIETIGATDSVKYYDYSISAMLQSDTLKSVESEGPGIWRQSSSDGSTTRSMFEVRGVHNPKVSLITEGKINLANGRVFSEDEIKSGKLVIMASEPFMKENNLSVGDSVTLSNIINGSSDSGEVQDIDKRDVTFEIIGTFNSEAIKDKENNNNAQGFQGQYDNLLITSNKVALEEATFSMEGLKKQYPEIFEDDKLTIEERIMQNVTPVYALNDPKDVESFRAAVDPTLPKFYKVSTSSDAYDSIAGPVKAMDSMAQITLIVAVSATILILSLVIVLFLRDRKHELGVYLSLGDRRGRVVGQIVMEVMLVAFVGLTLSLVTGNFLAKGLSSNLMKPSEDPMFGMPMFNDYGSGLNEQDVIEAYKVELTPEYVGLFYLIGLSVTAASTIVPTVYITRLNPKKIMM
ncbi:FtsX-like permease family protein [Erysipelothrix sp. HDW6B]|uniref:ABC transporter permease n=1 Tax=Erysipelothrix TaxID=1647 RepID=UPI001359D449|nr:MULTISPECIES: FtsX-like permease family protein [Erysipelothrix]QIK85518.1 FtsX-like permease family protein [Erysipelothrix sp. HDW6B]